MPMPNAVDQHTSHGWMYGIMDILQIAMQNHKSVMKPAVSI